METVIFRTIKGSEMEHLFNTQYESVNIRHYHALGDITKYVAKETYKFRIVIRHADDESADELFDAALNYSRHTKLRKKTKKQIFLISTEVGRIKGRLSFYIAEIMPDKGLRLIDNDFTCIIGSNRGIENEAVSCLITKKELSPLALDPGGYRNPETANYILIVVQGRGLNYINQV